MVFGGIETERPVLNQDTLWSGSPSWWGEGKYHEADALCKKMQGPYNQSYLPLGNLILRSS